MQFPGKFVHITPVLHYNVEKKYTENTRRFRALAAGHYNAINYVNVKKYTKIKRAGRFFFFLSFGQLISRNSSFFLSFFHMRVCVI